MAGGTKELGLYLYGPLSGLPLAQLPAFRVTGTGLESDPAPRETNADCGASLGALCGGTGVGLCDRGTALVRRGAPPI